VRFEKRVRDVREARSAAAGCPRRLQKVGDRERARVAGQHVRTAAFGCDGACEPGSEIARVDGRRQLRLDPRRPATLGVDIEAQRRQPAIDVIILH